MIEVAKDIIMDTNICTNCLGRQFALLGFGLTNEERGKIIQDALILEHYDKMKEDETLVLMAKKIAQYNNELAAQSYKRITKKEICDTKETCDICGGLFEHLTDYAQKIKGLLTNEDYQSFIVGAVVSANLIEKEDTLRAKYSITTGETIKEEFTREVGKLVSQFTKKQPSFDLPDITIIVNLQTNQITIDKRSLYIYGRYRKFIRTIPQTKWPCWECNSKGCPKCNFTGKCIKKVWKN